MERVDLFARRVAIQLSKQISEYSVVPNPDHPFLLSGPDLLMARPGALVAIFTSHAHEVRNINRLLSRMILNILALPSHTRFIVILRSYTNDISDLLEAIEANFENVIKVKIDNEISRDEMNKFKELLSERTPKRLRIEAKTRERMRARLGTAQVDYGDTSIEVADQSIIDSKNIGRHNTFDESKQTEIFDALYPGRSRTVRAIRDLVITSTLLDYLITDGIVSERESVIGKISDDLVVRRLLVSSSILKSHTFDFYKPFRAAAFAGWKLTLSSTVQASTSKFTHKTRFV